MGTNRWKKYKIEKLPIHYPSDSIESKFVSLVESIILKKEEDQDTFTEEEQEIDLMVYKLYELTYDEILIVDANTTITKEK